MQDCVKLQNTQHKYDKMFLKLHKQTYMLKKWPENIGFKGFKGIKLFKENIQRFL